MFVEPHYFFGMQLERFPLHGLRGRPGPRRTSPRCLVALVHLLGLVLDPLLTTLKLHYTPVPFVRTFPLTFQSGDIVSPELAYPARGWMISSLLVGAITAGSPILVYLLWQCLVKFSGADLMAAVSGSLWALLLGTLIQVVLKLVVGGLRPTFLETCQPDPRLPRNATGLDGTGFLRTMYSTDICRQPDKRALRDAVTSFPSGHATVAAAGFGFLFLWANAKLKVWADRRPDLWKVVFALAPLLGALVVCGSLTVNNAHHVGDILAGCVIGAVSALSAYRASYAAIWDWRYNHIPLKNGVPFKYAEMPVVEKREQSGQPRHPAQHPAQQQAQQPAKKPAPAQQTAQQPAPQPVQQPAEEAAEEAATLDGASLRTVSAESEPADAEFRVSEHEWPSSYRR